MPTVRIRERGQVTIPSSFRKDLGIEENDTLNVIKIDEMLILTPRKTLRRPGCKEVPNCDETKRTDTRQPSRQSQGTT